VASVFASAEEGSRGVIERLLPLRHWLGEEVARNIERDQARTRLICTLVGLAGFVVAAQFAEVPDGIYATSIVFPLYAIAMALDTSRRPMPSHLRRGISLLMDNLVNAYIASFGGPFAAYAGFNFLVAVGWGLRFGRHYLCLATSIAIAGMAYNMIWSPYWQANLLFGGTIIFGLLAAWINTAILQHRIALGARQLAERVDEIARLAWQDQLTKLPNRPHFHERLAQALAAATRSGRQVALLLFDIDGFKAVNDTLGHEAGDRLLQEIALRVGRRVRQADTFARYGGDEFVVLMELARDPSDAVRLAETLLKVIDEIDLFADAGLRVSASIGIACYSPAGQNPTPGDLLKRADRAMYDAKRAGKGGYRLAP
jgi:diguanylate cyclase (GGDEF)-like protein